jgi:hypothetical protein
MHPITSQMQAQVIGEDRLRAAVASRSTHALAPGSGPTRRVAATGALLRRLRGLAPTRSSRACEPAC